MITMTIVWIIGAAFTFGRLLFSEQYHTLLESCLAALACIVGWPVFLGYIGLTD